MDPEVAEKFKLITGYSGWDLQTEKEREDAEKDAEDAQKQLEREQAKEAKAAGVEADVEAATQTTKAK